MSIYICNECNDKAYVDYLKNGNWPNAITKEDAKLILNMINNNTLVGHDILNKAKNLLAKLERIAND